MADATLLPCPFPHEAKRGVFLEVDTEDFGFVRGACSDCGAAGPYVTLDSLEGATEDEKHRAAALWNTRQPQLPSDDGLIKALEPFARLARPKTDEPGAFTPIQCIDSLYGGTGELRLSSHVGSSDSYEIMWAADFERAAEALSRHKAPLSVAGDDVERLRESIVELWHQSEMPGALHEALCMTWEEYQIWANPDARSQSNKVSKP